MSQTITPIQNALDSLRRVAQELPAVKTGNALALKAVLAWGWHAVGLLAYLRLQPGRDTFDSWVQDYLGEGEPALNVERDARWEERQRLSFFELLDMLNAVELPILKPEFYQGWTDRTSRCHELRRKVAGLVGGSIDAAQRDQLLVLVAAYHRLIRLPARVTMDLEATRQALPALFDLAKLLVDQNWPEAKALTEVIEKCQTA